MKTQGQVHLRKRKLKRGGFSLYLDIYTGGLRRYEYLNLYLKEERTPADRVFNRETLAVAQAVAARRTIELQRSSAALPVASDLTVRDLVALFVKERQRRSAGTLEVWTCWERQVQAFRLLGTAAKSVNKEWWSFYKRWVDGLPLKPCTKYHYLSRMRCVINRAERDGLLAFNPCRGDRLQQPPKAEKVWLTAEELRRLKAASTGTVTQRAFLFSCLSGLRYSDIRALRWEDIQEGRLVKRIVKTGRLEYLDLNAQAVELLGVPATGCVFGGLLRNTANANYELRKWAARAGLTKRITFHTGRHTFAVLMLSAGVDIYTVSKLLGHSNITMTQIYADIVDARKKAAVELLPKI